MTIDVASGVAESSVYGQANTIENKHAQASMDPIKTSSVQATGRWCGWAGQVRRTLYTILHEKN